MITIHHRTNGQIHEKAYALGNELPRDAVWIDLENPDDEERGLIGKQFEINLPTLNDIQAIEASSRLHCLHHTTYLTIDVIAGADTDEPVQDSLLIVVTPKILVTMRTTRPKSITTFAQRIKDDPALVATPEDGLIHLLDSITDRIADILEILGRSADRLTTRIFKRGTSAPDKGKEERLQEILCSVGRIGDTTHKIQDSISGIARLITYLGHNITPRLNTAQNIQFQALDRDVASLTEHASFIQQQCNFLLDATLGQINVEQNNIIKFLSIVMVAFTPPTFFASLWGMNFHDMPEYALPYGYAMAWIVMAVSAVLPLIYFKKRGWM